MKKKTKRIISILMTCLSCAMLFGGCAEKPSGETPGGGNDQGGGGTVDDSRIEPDLDFLPDEGDDWIQLFGDTSFSKGFGAAYEFGTEFSIDNTLMKGDVLKYRDIGKDINLIPYGKATLDDNVTPVEENKNIFWYFGEGIKQNFYDEAGEFVEELVDDKITVNSEIVENTDNLLIVEQYNDYLHENYPDRYPNSDPKLVKRIVSDKNGKLTVHANSYNDIRNGAYNYISDFAYDTWPHFLLAANFREEIDLSQFSKIDVQFTIKINKLEQVNAWPAGPSDRYDQPELPEGTVHAPSEAMLCSYFFLRSKKQPLVGFFAGFNFYGTGPYEGEHWSQDQFGQAFYRIGTDHTGLPKIEGGKLKIGEEARTFRYDLKALIDYIMIRKMDTTTPTSPWYQMTSDDVTISMFNFGFENMGNWDWEYELSNVSAKAYPKEK